MTNPLADALAKLRLEGAIFLRGSYSEAWAYESVPGADLAALLVPGAKRVVLMHVIGRGRCWIQVGDGDRHWADAGDVVVLPYGDTHRMGGVESVEPVQVGTLVQPPPWTRMPAIEHGGGGDPTQVVCGYLASEDPLFDPRLSALPPVFVVSPVGEAREFVRASIAYALQQTAQVADDRFEVPPRLPELLLVEVLRLHLANAPAAHHGWLGALHHPVLAPAMAAMHAAPAAHWSVAELARVAAVSESLLDERFRTVLGMPPIRYLAGWRMHLARDLLESSELGVAVIAHRVGYESEEAFSRAFKRAHGRSPRQWRQTSGRVPQTPREPGSDHR
ncbi:MAG: AraC family transcriptional regulator [Nocardioides sp.]|nr:AraC family transcriptional regulator [Nocardioides sp.]